MTTSAERMASTVRGSGDPSLDTVLEKAEPVPSSSTSRRMTSVLARPAAYVGVPHSDSTMEVGRLVEVGVDPDDRADPGMGELLDDVTTAAAQSTTTRALESLPWSPTTRWPAEQTPR